MINERYQNAYAEVLHYLKGIKQNDIIKIPRGLINNFENFKNPKYICNFDYTKPLKELKLLEETKGLIGMICLNYWCDTKEKKQQFLNRMINNNKAKAYTEILTILNYIPKEEYEKIPKEIIQFYQENCDKEHNFTLDITKPLGEQKILKETNVIIVELFKNYFATQNQKEKLQKILLSKEEKKQ